MADSLHTNPGYSYTWAKSVVNKALEAHARVSDSFFEFTGLSKNQLILLLASGRPEWALLRDMLKQADDWAHKQESLGIKYASHGDPEFWRIIFTRKRANYPPKLKEYLDNKLKRANN